jgi:hypothetical protein
MCKLYINEIVQKWKNGFPFVWPAKEFGYNRLDNIHQLMIACWDVNALLSAQPECYG